MVRFEINVFFNTENNDLSVEIKDYTYEGGLSESKLQFKGTGKDKKIRINIKPQSFEAKGNYFKKVTGGYSMKASQTINETDPETLGIYKGMFIDRIKAELREFANAILKWTN